MQLFENLRSFGILFIVFLFLFPSLSDLYHTSLISIKPLQVLIIAGRFNHASSTPFLIGYALFFNQINDDNDLIILLTCLLLFTFHWEKYQLLRAKTDWLMSHNLGTSRSGELVPYYVLYSVTNLSTTIYSQLPNFIYFCLHSDILIWDLLSMI